MSFVDQLKPDDIVQLAHIVSPHIDTERMGAGLIQDVWPNYLSLFRQQLHTTTLVDGYLIFWNNANTRWEARALTAADIASGVLPIARGGTNSGVALNNNRILVSSGGAIGEAGALVNGQLLIGSSNAAPVVAALTAGTGITITNGAGSITTAISVPVSVVNGGTNSTTVLNNNRIMVSSGGAIVEAGAMTNGQVLIGSTGAAPVVAALTAGTGITITNGAGSITVASTASSTGVSVLNSNSGTNTNVAAGETDLMTYSMPGGTLGTNNDAVRLVAWGTTAANGNTKTIKAKFGATTILDTSVSTGAPNNNDWYLECVIIRISNTAQDSGGFYDFGVSSGTENGAKRAAPAETLSGAVTIKLTGQGGLSGDITQEGMIIEKLPAA